MSMQSQDIIRRSATNDLTPAAQVRDKKMEFLDSGSGW